MMAQPFDASRARLSQPDMFQRFRVPDEGKPITELGWARDEDILVVDRGRQRLAFRIRQMTYHHSSCESWWASSTAFHRRAAVQRLTSADRRRAQSLLLDTHPPGPSRTRPASWGPCLIPYPA